MNIHTDNSLIINMGLQKTKSSSVGNRQWRDIILPVMILLILGISLALGISYVEDLLPNFRLDHVVLHAVLETLGCMLALGIASFLLMRGGEEKNRYTVWLASSILVMGIIDAFHASMMPGNGFVYMRSIAQLVGGMCIALIWLPERLIQAKLIELLPKALAATVGLVCVILLTFPEIIPMVLADGRFTGVAIIFNFTGGVLFLAGVAYFIFRFDRNQDTMQVLFAVYCLLFGVAGLTFMFSHLWSAGWWILHIARLAGYVVAFRYVSASCSSHYLSLLRNQEILRHANSRVEESKRELEKLNEQLEASVQQANVLAQEAAAANQAKSEFLANMSHELRTPLHSILSFASFGIKKYTIAEPEKLQDYFNRIKQSGKTLLELLNDLLDLAKLESGKVVFAFKPTDLVMLIRSVTDELDALLSERDLNVQHEVLKFDGQVTLDADKIKQVLRNLLNNAIRFSPKGGIINIVICSSENSVRVSVCDRGPGIPQNELEAVFDKFVQSSKTKTGAGGTGLGLAICQEIIAAHRGRIWAENRPEGGAVFSFEIQLHLRCAQKSSEIRSG